VKTIVETSRVGITGYPFVASATEPIGSVSQLDRIT